MIRNLSLIFCLFFTYQLALADKALDEPMKKASAGDVQSKPLSDAQLKEFAEVLAEQGYVLAQYKLGQMYLYGDGVTQDYKQAAEWFKKAAEQGHPYGQYYLGIMYLKGLGVTQNYTEAEQWFNKAAVGLKKAADQGDADAQYKLGLMYTRGQGVTQDFKKAYMWFSKAAAGGQPEAVALMKENDANKAAE